MTYIPIASAKVIDAEQNCANSYNRNDYTERNGDPIQ